MLIFVSRDHIFEETSSIYHSHLIFNNRNYKACGFHDIAYRIWDHHRKDLWLIEASWRLHAQSSEANIDFMPPGSAFWIDDIRLAMTKASNARYEFETTFNLRQRNIMIYHAYNGDEMSLNISSEYWVRCCIDILFQTRRHNADDLPILSFSISI